ncbi:ATP-binding protein [Thermovenabulum sp.]|uniref:ATP-binding protein n=1 Tax=Thermovenabulum sp. TaxID=3100335 RepID=UPI003C7D98D9
MPLVVYKNISKDPVIKIFSQILKMLLNDDNLLEAFEKYHEFIGRLVEEKEKNNTCFSGNIWQEYILELILRDENCFSKQCESLEFESISDYLKDMVIHDLQCLKKLYEFDINMIKNLLMEKLQLGYIVSLPDFIDMGLKNEYPYPEYYFIEKESIKDKLHNSDNWKKNIRDLACFYKKVGCGNFGRYWAFKWIQTENGGRLEGIAVPDPVKLHEIIGYEEQKKEVYRNTKQFVKGFKANNVLLYGDRGTGKSSTVKALIHEFGKDGLRIVEVLKDQLNYLPEIISQLKNRPQRFIIFIDDLSFEEFETDYKYLKSILEGSLESTPGNVIIYATSNRRHLIREFFSDQREEEKRANETLEEKLSLSDRFGITVLFNAPNQEDYLKIVEGIAKNRGLSIDSEVLRKMALQWELWNNQRSGRTAKQFIDDLMGRMGIKN